MEKKVLIVDSDFFFVEFLADLLSDKGYVPVKTYDGKEGLQALDEHEFVLMFLDMVIPKVDGWLLIRYVRERFAKHPFPIVAVSGTIIEQLDELDSIGADYYIAKGPLDKMKDLFREVLEQVKIRPLPDHSDKRIYDLDILYPRRESVALIESLHFQRAITESIGIGILVVDRDTRILSANTAARDLLDRTEVNILNRPVASLFAAEDKTKLINGMKKIARDPDPGKVVLPLSLNGNGFRVTISLLSQEKSNKGWIFAMEGVEAYDEYR